MISDAQLGWVAAVVDMRGMALRKNNRMRATVPLVLAVQSKQMHVVRRLCDLTGITPEPTRVHQLPEQWTRRGCVEHCPDAHIHLMPDQPGMPLILTWKVTGVAAAIVLHNLLPYLLTVQEKGFDVMYHECMDNVSLQGQGSGAVRKTIARLSGLGWQLPPELVGRMVDDSPPALPDLQPVLPDVIDLNSRARK